jgi:hypothetical protein
VRVQLIFFCFPSLLLLVVCLKADFGKKHPQEGSHRDGDYCRNQSASLWIRGGYRQQALLRGAAGRRRLYLYLWCRWDLLGVGRVVGGVR